MSPEEQEQEALRALLSPDEMPLPAGLEERLGKCRVFGAASMTLLQQVKNEWLLRIPPPQMDNHYFATLSWLYIHIEDERIVRRACFGAREAFVDAVLDWSSRTAKDGAEEITAAQLAACDAIITDMLGLIKKAEISVVAKPDEPAPDPNEPPNS